MKPRAPLTLLAFAALAIALCLAGCSQSGGTSGSQVEQKTFPLVLQKDSEEAVEESEMNLYFVDGGDVPYVAASEFLPFFGSLYEDKNVDTPAIEFTMERVGDYIQGKRTDTEWAMDFNPKTDTIEFVSYDDFLQAPGDSALVSLVQIGEDGTGGGANLLKDSGNSYDRRGLGTTFEMAEYFIDIVEKDGECYVPLQTMHDILLARNYYYTVFNGQKVFVFAYGCDLNDQIYSVEPGQMSEEFAQFNYNELRFMLDNFYGLKPEHNISDFNSFAFDVDAYGGLSSTDPAAFDMALEKLTSRYLDDLHSGFTHGSCLAPEVAQGAEGEEGADTLETDGDVAGVSMGRAFLNTLSYGSARMKHNPDMNLLDEEHPVFKYEEVGDTAIVTFDSFTMDKKDYYKDADLDNPKDTIELIAAAHKQITRKDSPVKNVVLDLSCNGGGNADAAAFVIAWFTGSTSLGLRNTLTGAQSVVSYNADVNLDGEFDPYEDSLLMKTTTGELKLFCMTSPNSFSCGNLVPAAFEDALGITLIGKATGGGSCVVLPCTTASGAQFQVSGTSQISVIKNGSFYNTDAGIDVDATIISTDTMYDREQLVEFIHRLK